MSGVVDFLFDGQPPPSVTTYQNSATSMPQWFSDYTQGLLNRANQVAGDGNPMYSGPRVAAFNSDQKNAWDIVKNGVGDWSQNLDQAGSAIGAAANTNGLSQAMPFYNAAQGFMGQASGSTPANIQSYMSPYVGSVIDRSTQLANRNFDEKVMPTLEGQFVRAGQRGSTAHMREADRAARDLTEGVQSNAASILDKAYTTAGDQYQNDATRWTNLAGEAGTIGSNLGNLSVAQSGQQLQAGQALANLGQSRQALGMRDASALEAIGSQEQQQTQKNYDTAYGDFQQQRDYPRQTIDWMNSVIRGLPYNQQSSSTTTAPLDKNQQEPSNLSQILAAYGSIQDLFGNGKAKGGMIRSPLVQMYADGGEVTHIPGPRMAANFPRYRRGGSVLATLGY